MALTAKQKAINEAQRVTALAAKKTNVSRNASEASAKPRKVIYAGTGVQDIGSSFGGGSGGVVRAVRARRGQGD